MLTSADKRRHTNATMYHLRKTEVYVATTSPRTKTTSRNILSVIKENQDRSIGPPKVPSIHWILDAVIPGRTLTDFRTVSGVRQL